MNGKDYGQLLKGWYGQLLKGWYGQPCHKEWTAKITMAPNKAGMVNHATMKKTVKVTDTTFVGHVHIINNTGKGRNYMLRLKDAMQDT